MNLENDCQELGQFLFIAKISMIFEVSAQNKSKKTGGLKNLTISAKLEPPIIKIIGEYEKD